MVNWIDLILLGILGFGACLGFQKGFVKQVATLGSLAAGVVLAGTYHGELAGSSFMSFVAREYGDNAACVAAYVGVFAAVVLGAQLAAALIRRAIKGMAIEPVDCLAGGAVGLAKVYILCGVLIVGTFQFLPEGGIRRHVAGSYLAPRIARSMHEAVQHVPQAYRAAVMRFLDRAPPSAGGVPAVHRPVRLEVAERRVRVRGTRRS